jgi:FixJ family two-component response regulator
MAPPPLVVVIEDDRATLKALGRVLRAGGCEPALYGSPEEFLDCPPERSPLCVVIGVQLRQMFGLDLRRWLKALDSNVPVVVMTAFDDARVRAEARQIGCAGYLEKTADSAELFELIHTLQSM